MSECMYCNHDIGDDELVPSVDSDDEWERLGREHAADCEWIATRAHRQAENRHD